MFASRIRFTHENLNTVEADFEIYPQKTLKVFQCLPLNKGPQQSAQAGIRAVFLIVHQSLQYQFIDSNNCRTFLFDTFFQDFV